MSHAALSGREPGSAGGSGSRAGSAGDHVRVGLHDEEIGRARSLTFCADCLARVFSFIFESSVFNNEDLFASRLATNLDATTFNKWRLFKEPLNDWRWISFHHAIESGSVPLFDVNIGESLSKIGDESLLHETWRHRIDHKRRLAIDSSGLIRCLYAVDSGVFCYAFVNDHG